MHISIYLLTSITTTNKLSTIFTTMAPNFSEEDSMFGLYFILGILLGSIPAIYFLYKMLRDINDSNFELMLDESYQSNKTKKNQSIETATCRICNTFHTNRNPLSLGGCAIITCENCYKEYKFLPTRCGLCQAYLCYRKYRSPLLSLQSPKKCIVIKETKKNK